MKIPNHQTPVHHCLFFILVSFFVAVNDIVGDAQENLWYNERKTVRRMRYAAEPMV